MAPRDILQIGAARQGCYWSFVRHCWRSPLAPFVSGRHTRRIVEVIERAREAFYAGRSTYVIVIVPFRHGKTDLIGRYLAPFLLGHDPNLEVMYATYGDTLSKQI